MNLFDCSKFQQAWFPICNHFAIIMACKVTFPYVLKAIYCRGLTSFIDFSSVAFSFRNIFVDRAESVVMQNLLLCYFSIVLSQTFCGKSYRGYKGFSGKRPPKEEIHF